MKLTNNKNLEKAIDQIRKARRWLALGIIGGVLVVGTTLFLALSHGQRKAIPIALVPSVPENVSAPATQEPLNAVPTCPALSLKEDSCMDTEAPGTLSAGSLDDPMLIQASVSSNREPGVVEPPQAELPFEAAAIPQPAISAAPSVTASAQAKTISSKPKKAKHVSATTRRHSQQRKTYATVFPEHQNYLYGFPAVSN